MAADEKEIGGDEDQEEAVNADDFRRSDDRREVAAREASERHAAAERHHINAHHAAAHLVRSDELYERGDGRKHHHQRRAGEEEQDFAQPHHPRHGERQNQETVDRLHQQRRQSHPLKLSKPSHDERANDRAGAGKRHQVAVRAGASTKHALREHGQKRQDCKPEKCRGRREDNEGDEAAVVAHVVEAALQLVSHAPGMRRRDVLHVQRHQRADDDEERQRIEEKGRVHRLRLVVPPFEERGERRGEQQRSEHPRQVELDRTSGRRARPT